MGVRPVLPQLFLPLLALSVSPYTAAEGEIFSLHSRLSGFTYTHFLLFQRPVPSRGAYAILCASRPDCVAFTLALIPGSPSLPVDCRGHSALLTSVTPKTEDSHAQFFLWADVSDWLGRPCSVHSDCEVTGAQCLAGSCVCGTDGFYSHGSNACVSDCTDGSWQASYVTYPMTYLSGNNDYYTYGGTFDQCYTACSANMAYPTFEFNTNNNNYCNCHLVSTISPNINIYSSQTFTLFQRTCA